MSGEMQIDEFDAFRESLKYQLRLKGSSFSKISHKLGVSETAVSYVAKRRNHSERIEQAIAEAIECDAGELFEQIDQLQREQK